MAEVLRVTIKGGMPNGEEWSVNPIFSIGGDFGVPVSNAQANAIATAIAAIVVPTGMTNAMSSGTNVTGARVEARSLAGVLEAQAEALKASPTAGGGSAPHPFQTSAVLSLRTGTPGPSGRGRLFWPATGMGIDGPTLRMNVTAASGLLAGAKTYLSAIEAAIEVSLTGVALAVWSRKGSGSLSVVNSIQLGNVFDVQRRRRDALVESVTAVAYP